MIFSSRLRSAFAFFAILSIVPARAVYAAPEEIQVYMDEINKPREIGLDVHLNYVARGEPGADFAGGEPSLHDFRVTPEFSYGLGHGFEAGLYLPLATIDGGGVLRAQGAKVRVKWIAAHHEDAGFYWGGNFEIGRVSHRLDQNPWNAELKGIAGWRRGKWNAAVNGNLGFVVSGPAPGPATLELASKLNYKLAPKIALGVESYNGLGELKALGHLPSREQSSYATIDSELGKWNVNAGVGIGYGANRDHLLVKIVVGVPLK